MKRILFAVLLSLSSISISDAKDVVEPYCLTTIDHTTDNRIVVSHTMFPKYPNKTACEEAATVIRLAALSEPAGSRVHAYEPETFCTPVKHK